MSDRKKVIICAGKKTEHLASERAIIGHDQEVAKRTPATDKEALFEWAEDFVRRYDEDFEELAKR